MSNPYLMPEILDYIIDLLRDEPKALKECCLVSKSWVPRARKHLFADVKFHSAANLESWKKTFPDPANSPAYHTHALFVGCPQAVADVDAEEGGWIQSFSRIERLRVSCNRTSFNTIKISLVPFHKFSSSLKSLHVTSLILPHSQIFNLIHSLPLLEDLTLIGHDMSATDDDEPHGLPIAVPPALTGTIELVLYQGMVNTPRRLLDLPKGLHFRKLNLSWRCEGDLHWMVRLVTACSRTLEYLDVTCELDDESTLAPIDLSKATNLKGVVFQCGSLSSGRITRTLETITFQHQDLQKISIHVPHILSYIYVLHEDGVTWELIEAANPSMQWPDLDRLLVQFWDSRSIRPKVVYPRTKNEKRRMKGWVGNLLPEIKKRGIIDLVEESGGSQ